MKNFYHQEYRPSNKFRFSHLFWILFLLLFVIVMIVPSIIVHRTGVDFAFSKGTLDATKQTQTSTISQNDLLPSLTIGWVLGNDSTLQHLKDYKNLKIVSPVLASVDNQYRLQVQSDPSLTSTIQKQGKIIWARMIMSTDTQTNIHSFLASPNKTTDVINQIYQSARTNHWYGINLDIENVSSADRAAFSQFLKNLSAKLNQSSIILSIDLPPDSKGNNMNEPFDHAEIGKYCNYIVFMGYDQHWSTDPVPGPVTSLSWLKENVQEFIQTGIPAEKIILGLPAYTRIWKQNQQGTIVEDPAEPISYVENLVGQNHLKLSWDPVLGEYYTSYTVNKLQYKIWLPTEKSFNLYLNLISQYHLAGSAVWNLNQINPNYWNKIYNH